MKDSDKDFPNKTPGNKSPRKDAELDELRRLLLGQEQTQIAQLKERLNNPSLLVKDVGRVLPEAIKLRTSRDKEIAKALEPNIEEGLRASIKKDPKALADTLYPIMGPSIRKAISSAILGMIQSINHIIEHTFSVKGLKWRLEALTTKKPFAEVVLLNTLIYQVEQVFLIHRNTGLVLQHVVAKEVTTHAPDLISSMLTAIQDFVQDSFGVEKGESLDTLRMEGDHSVWIEQGPQAILAAVIRGTPPLDVRSVFRETLEDIHIQQSDALKSFEGDTTPFESIKNQLEYCLQFQAKEKTHQTSPLLWVLLGAIVFFISIWFFSSFREHQQWEHFLVRLNGEPGIVVAATEKRSGKYYISGLRDPLASDPVKMLQEAKLKSDKAVFLWETYHSFYPEFMLKRIKNILKPPETIMLELKNGVLYAHGSALHQWLDETRRLVKTIPGITHFREDDVVDMDLRDFIIIKEKIEKQSLLIYTRGIELAPGQEDMISGLVADISKLRVLAQVLGKRTYIEIVGHSDSSGSDEKNMEISLERANYALFMLVSKGLEADNVSTMGMGPKEPGREEITEQDKKFNRRVTFKVILSDNQI